jgi:hypothetical protein
VRRSCVSRRQGCGLIPHLLIEKWWSRPELRKGFGGRDRLFLGVEKVATGKEAGIERLAWAMRAHTSMHQTTCILISAARHMVCQIVLPGQHLSLHRQPQFSFLLEMQKKKSHSPGRPRPPQALLSRMPCKKIESSSAKQQISTASADLVQRIQDAQAEAKLGTRCARSVFRVTCDRLGAFFRVQASQGRRWP